MILKTKKQTSKNDFIQALEIGRTPQVFLLGDVALELCREGQACYK